jgi:hypothetical protein
MAFKYEVVVGNVGILPYTSKKLAEECYDTYVTLSKNGEGRAGGEPVTLFLNGDLIKEHIPSDNTDTD